MPLSIWMAGSLARRFENAATPHFVGAVEHGQIKLAVDRAVSAAAGQT
jgi:hypothetical protein